MHREGELDLRTAVGGDLGVVPALVQVSAEMDGMGLHTAKRRRELGEDQQKPEGILPPRGTVCNRAWPARLAHTNDGLQCDPPVAC